MKHPIRRPLFFGLAVALVALTAFPAAAAPEQYEVDPGHSALLFRIKHVDVGYTYGRFNEFSGSLVVDDANLGNAKVEIVAKVESIDSNDGKRDQHLKSPDFFNVAQFPTLRYVSTSVSKSGDAYTVQGNLTLHGVTKAITIKMKKTGEGDDPYGNHRVGFEGQLTFKRSDFGMDKMPQAVGDTVWVTVAVEGVRK